MAEETLGDLADEFRSEGLGPLLQARTKRIAVQVLKRYPARVYARAGDWDEEAVREVIQDVFVQLLDGQLAAIFDFAKSPAGVDYALREVVRDVLAWRRQRTVIDNLIDRAREAAASPPYAIHGEGAQLRIGLEGMPAVGGALTDDEVRAAAQRVVIVPRMPARTIERAPRIYTAEGLHGVLSGAVRGAGRPVGLTDLRRILEMALTHLAVSELQYIDDRSDDYEAQGGIADRDQASPVAAGMAEPLLEPSKAALASQLANTMIERFSPEQRTVVRLKFAGASDTDVAKELGMSRPTAANRKEEAYEILRTHLGDLEEDEVTATIDVLLTRLAGASDGQ